MVFRSGRIHRRLVVIEIYQSLAEEQQRCRAERCPSFPGSHRASARSHSSPPDSFQARSGRERRWHSDNSNRCEPFARAGLPHPVATATRAPIPNRLLLTPSSRTWSQCCRGPISLRRSRTAPLLFVTRISTAPSLSTSPIAAPRPTSMRWNAGPARSLVS